MNMKTNSHIETTTSDPRSGRVGKLADGRSYVEFERYLSHPVARVWAAITDPAELERWVPEFRLEPRQGGRYEFDFGGDEGNGCEGGPAVIAGTISRFEPMRVLECGTMRWELHEEGEGCLLRFTDILNFDQDLSESAIENSVLEGWNEYLDRLEQAI